MGVWGAGIFSDDNAADLRDEFRDLIGDGIAGPEATNRLITQRGPRGDPDLEPVFWLALALTQWACGKLEERVKSAALRVIENGSAMRPWLGGPDERKRRKVLEAAKTKLESPQPPERKIKKRRLATCDWERGELFAYRMRSGEYVVLRMLDLSVDKGGAYPDCELLDWRGAQLPTLGLPDTTPARELRDYGGGKRFRILSFGKRFLGDRLTRLNIKHQLAEGYSRVSRGRPNPTRITSWKDFDQLLEKSYQLG
jgi:hypothetical protein